MARFRQKLDYCSREKFQGLPNLLFVTKLTGIKKKNPFSVEKEI